MLLMFVCEIHCAWLPHCTFDCDQALRLSAGADGLVEAADNTQFGAHVYKWGQGSESLDAEAEALLMLRGRNIVQYFGRCRVPGPIPNRHAGKVGLVMERMKKTLWDLLVDSTRVK